MRLGRQGAAGASHWHVWRSVGATENTLLAATLAKGTSILRNAAMEPEIGDLAELLNKMGARIEGMGTSTLAIQGVDALHGTAHATIPDRIEAGTHLCAVAIAGGDVVLGASGPMIAIAHRFAGARRLSHHRARRGR